MSVAGRTLRNAIWAVIDEHHDRSWTGNGSEGWSNVLITLLRVITSRDGFRGGLEESKEIHRTFAKHYFEESVCDALVTGTRAQQAAEDLSAQITGATDTFTLDHPHVLTTLQVYVNGLHQGIPPKHFTIISGTRFKFLDFMLQPAVDELFVRYEIDSEA